VVRFAIEDDGPGFPDVAPEQLFEPFFTTKPEGHGVGLAAVQGVLANHGGAVRVSAGSGPADRPGALVELFLPRSDRPELAWDELAQRDGRGHGRVWVLDDQTQILEFSRIALNARGFEARVFGSVKALVEAAASAPPEERPDVVVLDVVMPDGGGPEAFERLEALGALPRVLWVSGYTPDDVNDVVARGAFLAKPYTGSALADAVVRLISNQGAENA
jgi:CheY-like chemotaxis protein